MIWFGKEVLIFGKQEADVPVNQAGWEGQFWKAGVLDFLGSLVKAG
jgi:hypothetical protein